MAYFAKAPIGLRRSVGRLCGIIAVAVMSVGPTTAETSLESIAQGKAIAEANCAVCHAIGADGNSPNEKAPAFRTLHERYNVEHLEEALAEGIVVGHGGAEMPVFEFDVDQITAFIGYLKTLEDPGDEG